MTCTEVEKIRKKEEGNKRRGRQKLEQDVYIEKKKKGKKRKCKTKKKGKIRQAGTE